MATLAGTTEADMKKVAAHQEAFATLQTVAFEDGEPPAKKEAMKLAALGGTSPRVCAAQLQCTCPPLRRCVCFGALQWRKAIARA